MVSFHRITALSSFILPFLPLSSALPNITRTGKYLYDPDGNRFSIKGVAYQPQGKLADQTSQSEAQGGFPEPSSYIDPLSSPANCSRDLPYLQKLGVNAVRVYSVNSSLNHDECMDMLDKAGIYVLLDVSLPLNGSIDRAQPSWSTNLLDAYITTINAFNNYTNILGYTVGNEVVNLPSNANALPYVKAAARDVKAYLKGIGSTALVSYAAVDGPDYFRNAIAEYLTCGNDSIAVDLYGFNNYEWCGNENINSSHWNTITSGFSNLSVATYMSEYGCIKNGPRVWNEVAALFSPPVSDVFSGGVAFSYFPTSDGYGMITLDGDAVQATSDFNLLATWYGNTSTPTTPKQSSASTSNLECPSTFDLPASFDLPPTPDEAVCDCINQNAFACHLTTASANQPDIIGSLLDYTCSLLGSSGASATCDEIGGNGTSGQYGQLSYCSPAIKLNYAMSAYWEFNPKDTSCDFSGNATLVSDPPNTPQDASNAASKCMEQMPSGGVFTPTPTMSSAHNSATGGNDSTSSRPSGAACLSRPINSGLIGIAVGCLGMVIGGWSISTI